MTTKTKNLLLNSAFGFILCIILGYAFFGTAVFKLHNSAQTIVIYGFYGAVFYSVLKYRNRKDQIFIALAILIIDFITMGKSLRFSFLLRDILYIGGLLSAVAVYKLFIDKYKTLPLFARSLALPLFLGINTLLALFILFMIYKPGDIKIKEAMFMMLNYAALIGIGLGFGFDIYEKVKAKII